MEQKAAIYNVTVDEEKTGTRIDVVLSFALQETSRSFLQKLIEAGHVTVNGKLCTSKKYKVTAGETVSVEVPEPELLEAVPQNIPLDIVYEDDALLVVNKPKGMVVHPAAGNYEGTLVNALMYHCEGKLSSINGVIRPGIVHRIDKDTSGLLVVAKTDTAHNGLAEQFAVHSITRVYHAIVHSNIKEDEGTIDRPLGRDPKNRMKRAVTDLNSKRAVTHFEVLERFGGFTYVAARLETGRTHQIRVHMAYIHHPLLGDELYGPQKTAFGAHGQMLHAKTLGFVHPVSGEYMEFDSSLPDEFCEVLEKLRKQS